MSGCAVAAWRCLGGGRIHEVAQFLAGLEIWHPFRRYLHFGTGLGISTRSRFALADAEAAEAADLDLVAGLQGADDRFEDGLNNHFAVAAGQVPELRYFFNQVCFRHD